MWTRTARTSRDYAIRRELAITRCTACLRRRPERARQRSRVGPADEERSSSWSELDGHERATARRTARSRTARAIAGGRAPRAGIERGRGANAKSTRLTHSPRHRGRRRARSAQRRVQRDRAPKSPAEQTVGPSQAATEAPNRLGVTPDHRTRRVERRRARAVGARSRASRGGGQAAGRSSHTDQDARGPPRGPG